MFKLPITEYRKVFNRVFKDQIKEVSMVTLEKVDSEEIRKQKLKALYNKYEENILTIHRCKRELDEVLKDITKQYEQEYLEVAGVK